MQNIHECIAAGTLSARVECVISSRDGVQGLDRAAKCGLTTHVVQSSANDESGFHERMAGLLDIAGVQLICLCGFTTLWRIPPRYQGRVINIHPALLPKFGGYGYYGLKVHEAVLAAGEKESGCTVHYCDNEYDHGPIILQRRVTVRRDDTAESLADRVFAEECIAYPQVIQMFADGRVPSYRALAGQSG